MENEKLKFVKLFLESGKPRAVKSLVFPFKLESLNQTNWESKKNKTLTPTLVTEKHEAGKAFTKEEKKYTNILQ